MAMDLESRVVRLENRLGECWEIIKEVQRRNKELMNENKDLQSPAIKLKNEYNILRAKARKAKTYVKDLEKVQQNESTKGNA